MKHQIGTTHNGIPVYVDLILSVASAQISRQPRLLELVKEVLPKITARGPEACIEYNMGRTVGYNFIVRTTEKDNILYARLLREDTYTRFVKNGRPRSTQYLTLDLRLDTHGNYELHDLWVGRLRPPRPGSTNETPESKVYWAEHAFVLDTQPLQPRTITKVCPY